MLTDRPCLRPLPCRLFMLSRLIPAALCALALSTGAANAFAEQQAAHGMARVFLDCNRCDVDYLKREVTFVDYVRNREDADVHVLVTTQDTGGGGRQWTLKFIGLSAYQGVDQTLIYNQPQTATPDETRAGFAEVLKLGLVRYASATTLAGRLHVTFKKPDADSKATPEHDPWNYWVYRLGAGGDMNGEESSKGRAFRGSFSANRTTDAWR